jgi:hypothetical protein
VKSLLKQWREGMSPAEMNYHLASLNRDLEKRAEAQRERRFQPRERGADYVRERLLRAVRHGEISRETQELAEWLLKKNPEIAADLAISIRTPPVQRETLLGTGGGQAGTYNSLSRLVTIFSGRAGDLTAAHEILHHSEKLLPAEAQREIRKEWLRRVGDLRNDKDPAVAKFASDVVAAEATNDGKVFQQIQKDFEEGKLPASLYEYSTPSEFWAVNASQMVRTRAQEGWVKQVKRWLSDLVEKAKSIFGLKSDAPIIRGLDSVIAGKDIPAGKMLFKATTFPEVTPSEKPAPLVIPTKAPEAVAKDAENFLKGSAEASRMLDETSIPFSCRVRR